MTNTVKAWFEGLSPEQHIPLIQLRQLILATGMSEALKWGQPCYSANKLCCYLQKAKGHVTIGFQQGAHIADPRGVLVGAGKDMRSIKIPLGSEIDREVIAALVNEAIRHDQM